MFLSLKGSLNTKFPRFKGILDTYAGASAAYSLRRLSRVASSVVRVRRASDNSEKDFSATDVSSGAMTDWVNTDVLTYESDFSSGTDGFVTTASPSLDGNIDSIGGRNDNLRLTSNAPLVTVNTYFRRNSILSVGNSYRVTFDAYIPSTNSVLDDFDTVAFGTSQVNVAGQITLDQWTSYDVTGTANATALFIRLKGNSSGDATGDVVYIRNVQITQTTAHGFVETWYDQSGNGNDATQQVSGSQPKIVDAGSLLNKLKFEGAQFLQRAFTSPLSQPNSSFVVAQMDAGTGNTKIFDGVGSLSRNALFASNDTDFAMFAGSIQKYADRDANENLHTAIFNQDSSLGGLNGVVTSISGIGPQDAGGITIGKTGVVETGFLTGTVSELIFYPSDQSANREAIEANINNQYDIY